MKILYIVAFSLFMSSAVHAEPPRHKCPDKYFMQNMVGQMPQIIYKAFSEEYSQYKVEHIHAYSDFYVKQINRPQGVECHYYLTKEGHQVSDVPMFEFFVSDKK